MDKTARISVWCLLRDQYAHVKPVESYFGEHAGFIYDGEWEPIKMVENEPDIILCVNDHPYEIARCLQAGREAGIPSLVLQDGILEWRCQYENPKFGMGGGAPQHQPVMADKIACIGLQSARQIAAWGNGPKVEVTGMPRLDSMLAITPTPLNKPGKRMLVMTAKKPWFTDEQRDVTMRSLIDMKAYLEHQPQIEVVWRLTKDVSNTLGVENKLQELSTLELSKLLQEVDAVITTVSTTLLESMLAGRPVAALDYHNVPRFVPTVWNITAREQISQVVPELLDPAENKMAFQRDCLEYVLRMDGPAAGHVGELIHTIVNFNRQSRQMGQIRSLPPNLLSVSGLDPSQKAPGLAELYPGQQAFNEDDPKVLQAMLARSQAEIRHLEDELDGRRIGYWVNLAGRYLAKKVSYKNK